MVNEVLRYFFQELERRHPSRWLGSKRPGELSAHNQVSSTVSVYEILEEYEVAISARYRQRLTGIRTIAQLLEQFALTSIRLDSQLGLWGWCAGKYPLHLRYDIPTSEEMLAVQCQGQRIVTWLRKPEEQLMPIGRHAGAFEFLLHDLEHAHKFFGDPFSFRGQTHFFNFLRAILPVFARFQSDPLFVKDLNYLKSDMNSHPVHLFKYLKAIVLSAHLRETHASTADLNGFWMEVLDGWPHDRLAAALRINHPDQERPEDPVLVSSFFADL